MNSTELLRIVDVIHREKDLSKEIVFQGLEAALLSAAKRHYGEDAQITITIDREKGTLSGECDGQPMSPHEISERIAAQTARQVMIQKIREAERDALFEEYKEQRNQLVVGIVQRYDGGAATVALSDIEAILPRSEQMPGERYEVNSRVRATIFEVKKQGSRVRIILSRIRPQLVQRLFEQEIPEIADNVIEIKAIAREAGYRTKIAVASSDPRVDCVGACVGIRGSRIKGIHEELGGERIDVIPWSGDPLEFISNALKPAEIEEVILCQMLGRAIVLVQEDQLSLAIGRFGQNVWLASKLCGWDIDIMTREELEEELPRAVSNFCAIEGVAEELAEQLVGEGFLSYADLSVIEPDDLMEMGGLTEDEVNRIVDEAEKRAEAEERAVEEERKRQKELRKTQGSKGGRASDRPTKEDVDSASQDQKEQTGSSMASSSSDLEQRVTEQQNGGDQKAVDQVEADSSPVSSSTTTVSGEIVSGIESESDIPSAEATLPNRVESESAGEKVVPPQDEESSNDSGSVS